MNKYMKGFVRSYIATALWSSSDTKTTEDGDEYYDELDSMVANDQATLSYSMTKQCIHDCQRFIILIRKYFKKEEADYILNREASDLDYLAPHEFWLTRNGHGAGFRDGDWDGTELGDFGDDLTWICKNEFKPVDLYVGDDNRIYLI